MTPSDANRRQFLKVAAGTTAAAAALTQLPRRAAAAGVTSGQKAALTGIDGAFQRAVDANKVPGVVAMAATDKGIIFDTAVGYRDLESGRRMTLDTVFWIASMTKAVTATACMQMVEQGKLRLDQNMGELLPYLAEVQVLEGFDDIGATETARSEAADHAPASFDPHGGLHLRRLERADAQVREGDRHPVRRHLPNRSTQCTSHVRPGRPLGVRHQHRLGRSCRGEGERPVAGGLFPRAHLRAARHDGHRLPDRLEAAGQNREAIPEGRQRRPWRRARGPADAAELRSSSWAAAGCSAPPRTTWPSCRCC